MTDNYIDIYSMTPNRIYPFNTIIHNIDDSELLIATILKLDLDLPYSIDYISRQSKYYHFKLIPERKNLFRKNYRVVSSLIGRPAWVHTKYLALLLTSTNWRLICRDRNTSKINSHIVETLVKFFEVNR